MRSLGNARLFQAFRLGALLALASPPAAGALDNPVVDTRSSRTATVLTDEVLSALPTERNFYETLKLAPQMQLKTEVNSRGAPTRTWFGNDSWSIQGSVTRYRKLEGSYELRKDRVTFPSGHTGNVRLSVHSLPNPRVNFQATNLRFQGARLPDESWLYLPGAGAADPSPSEPMVPVIPVPPSDPTASGFVPYLGGPILRDGTKLNFAMEVLPHNNHESHAVTWQAQRYYLCQKAIGTTQGTMRNATADAFELVRTAPPRQGFEWSTFFCQKDAAGAIGCNGEGTFYGQRVLARGTAVAQPGSMGGEGKMDVEVVQTKSVVPFSLKYSF